MSANQQAALQQMSGGSELAQSELSGLVGLAGLSALADDPLTNCNNDTDDIFKQLDQAVFENLDTLFTDLTNSTPNGNSQNCGGIEIKVAIPIIFFFKLSN